MLPHTRSSTPFGGCPATLSVPTVPTANQGGLLFLMACSSASTVLKYIETLDVRSFMHTRAPAHSDDADALHCLAVASRW